MAFFRPEGGFRLQDFGLRGGGAIAGCPTDVRLMHPWLRARDNFEARSNV